MDLNWKLLEKFNSLNDSDFKHLIVDNKRLGYILKETINFSNRTIQSLNQWIKAIHERYWNTLWEIEWRVNDYEAKVKDHLKEMWFNL